MDRGFHSVRPEDFPWSHADIKAALIAETAGKCAYCEARMLAVSFGDIEHIYPKSMFPELVVSWNNLTLACSGCNQRKSSKYDASSEFINPYVDDPAEHLFFLGPAVYERTNRGMYTIVELGLNDIPRIEARMRAIENAANLVARFQAATDDTTKSMLWRLIDSVLQGGEYTAAVSTYVSAAIQPASSS
ncbi:HNH endonuclease [Microbacterium sp. NPDC056234]|uniref:HNH endonuclease n=1 Tax=Microbacterium sp. NPDC056234 TaxID=3345757 RepID=UPI0035DD7FE2